MSETQMEQSGGCCGGGCCGGAQAQAQGGQAQPLQLQVEQQQAQEQQAEQARRETKPASATGVHLEPGAAVPSATPAAQAGPEHVEEPVAYDGILLSGFGGPEGQDDVIPFLRNVTRGRGIPDERLEEVSTHYRHFGGVSPINQQNRDLKAALEGALAAAGVDLPVYWGNRNWAPYLDEALQQAADAGATTLLAIPTSAYSSYSSCRQYREDWADALEATGLQGTIQIDKVRQFFNHPGFLAPFVDGVRASVDEARAAGFADADIEVLFATHSIPTADAERSGAPDLHQWGPGGGYEGQHLAAAEHVMAEAAPGLAWQLVYQSRSGPASQPWLEPDINDAIGELQGRKAVVIVPLGFVSDHMEVMWDLDEEAIETATEAGLWVRRAPTPGVDAQYVGALVDLVQERLEGRPAAERKAVTSIPAWYDVCRPGCCENPRLGFRPAIAGLQP
ncbi:ferrochelatase [Agrococcus sp. KRD186]|uniref:ferrochelatase n=1 Tax=Agrococcus sp. KRD186 TaxID=2729730 RepID=UPI0031454E54